MFELVPLWKKMHSSAFSDREREAPGEKLSVEMKLFGGVRRHTALAHFIKVIIVLIVLLLSPVVTEAGLGSGHTLIGRRDPPSCHDASVSCVCARAATPLFWYFIYSRNPRWLLWMSRSHSRLRMQVAAEKTTFPRPSHPLEFNSYGAEEALTSV